MSPRPTHFLDIERPGTGPLCATGGRAASGDPTTVLVERVTCEACLDAINRRLAGVRNRGVVNRKRYRRKAGRAKAAQIGGESQ
jgi:hypothetical protein